MVQNWRTVWASPWVCCLVHQVRATHSDNWTSEFLPRQRIILSLFYLPLFTLWVLSFIGFCESVSVPGCFLFFHFACGLFLFAIFLFLPFPVETCHCKTDSIWLYSKMGTPKKKGWRLNRCHQDLTAELKGRPSAWVELYRQRTWERGIDGKIGVIRRLSMSIYVSILYGACYTIQTYHACQI